MKPSEEERKKLGLKGSKKGISYGEYGKYIDFILKAHDKFDMTGKEKFRQLGKTPYPTHPIFAAQLVLADRRVSWRLRADGFRALLLHDVLENTKAKIPSWVPSSVKKLVNKLTFKDEKTEEAVAKRIDQNDSFTNYLLLADTVSNLYEEHVSEQKREAWIKGVKLLMSKIEKDFGKTRLYQISGLLSKNTDWSGAKIDTV